jgi:hypothetical protein
MGSRSFEGTLSARMVLRVVELCRARGHDVDAMCARVALSPAALAVPDARVHYTTAARLGEVALEVSAYGDRVR